VLVAALILAASVETVALFLLLVMLLRTRRKLTGARGELAESGRRTPRSPAAMAMKAVAQTAARVREQGLVGGLLTSSFEDLGRWMNDQRSDIAQVAAPDGTIAIFFSDIENSTVLNEQLGDEQWVRVLSAHNTLVRRSVERCGGHIVKSQGDGFMIVFRESTDAAHAALDVQRAFEAPTHRSLRRTQIRIRIGLHVGETVSREGDYFGRNVAMAARIATSADGGEVLVSDELRTAITDVDQFHFEPRGEVQLKGLADRHRLWELRGSRP
jgi:class 3 adenylate cyclase